MMVVMMVVMVRINTNKEELIVGNDVNNERVLLSVVSVFTLDLS
jgi:hypothetical protein